VDDFLRELGGKFGNRCYPELLICASGSAGGRLCYSGGTVQRLKVVPVEDGKRVLYPGEHEMIFSRGYGTEVFSPGASEIGGGIVHGWYGPGGSI
jgi:hypothetical protein